MIATIAVLVVLSDAGHRVVLTGLEYAQRVAAGRPAAAMALIVVFSALAAMLAFVSSWVVLPFAVFTWGPAIALALLWTGWLLGGATTYAIGRLLGRPAVRRLLPREALERYEERFTHHMPFYVVLLVQLALPSEVPGYLLGIVRYSFIRYLAALGLVELAYALVTVYLGEGLLQRRLVPVVASLVLLALLTLAAVWRVRGLLATKAQGPSATRTPSLTRSLG